MVLVGAGTVRAENYGAPSRSDLRIAVVTRSCALDFDTPLFTGTSGASTVVTTSPDPLVNSGVSKSSAHDRVTTAIRRSDRDGAP
ncbi:MAG: hypothetical protein ACKOQ7_01435 [Actinomycetota bacterium]